jgi:hypothetical protein
MFGAVEKAIQGGTVATGHNVVIECKRSRVECENGVFCI